MARYRVLKRCFHNSIMYEPGRFLEATFEEGKAPKHLELVDDAPAEDVDTDPSFKAVHKGKGKWSVVGPDGEEVDSGLSKDEAQIAAADKADEAKAGE